MIKDNLKNYKLYLGLSEDIKTALLSASQLNENSPLGKVVLCDNVYYTVMEYFAREEGDGETHNNFADIQIILDGKEKIGYAPKKNLETRIPYNAEKDIEIVNGKFDYINMEKGDFMILFPDDGHSPSVKTNEFKVKKVVYKIKLS